MAKTPEKIREVVTTGKLQVQRFGKNNEVTKLDISMDDVREKAMRCCRTGHAACCFADVEMGNVIVNGKMEVTVLGNPQICTMTPDLLQVGLDRLSASATPVTIASAK